MAELWDLYDGFRRKTGKFHERGNLIPEGYLHIIIHAWIRNREGKYLMSQRHPQKSFPLTWECTGGSVLRGEDSLSGALREVREELGVSLDRQKGVLFKSERQDVHRVFYDVWLFSYEQTEPLKLQPEEVVNAKWMSEDEIRQCARAGELMPMLGYYEDVFAFGNARGDGSYRTLPVAQGEL